MYMNGGQPDTEGLPGQGTSTEGENRAPEYDIGSQLDPAIHT